MTGWLKVEKDTARKPQVLRIADILAIHPDQAFGLTLRWFSWVDDHVILGHAPRVTNVTLDSVFGYAGFSDALLAVDWLRVRDGSLEVPNFDRHLSAEAKNRALAGERKKKQRHDDVTKVSRKKRDTGEKSDIYIPNTLKQTSKRFVIPSIEEVTLYCVERKKGIDPQKFFSFYESKGWMIGKNKMKNWKAAIHTWEKNDDGGKSGQVDQDPRGNIARMNAALAKETAKNGKQDGGNPSGDGVGGSL